MRHEIYCQKYGVQEHNSAAYFIFLECCPSQKDFCFNSSVISLSWGTKCSMPLLSSCPARWTGNPLGSFSKLVPCRCSFAQGDHFSGAITGGWEALRCKGESWQGLLFQLWGTTLLLSWCTDLESTEVQVSPLDRQTACGGPIWLSTVGLELCGGPWPAEMILCWWSQCSALGVPVILLAGWFLQACLRTNPSTWIRACCFVSLSSPPSQLTRDNWEHKSLPI